MSTRAFARALAVSAITAMGAAGLTGAAHASSLTARPMTTAPLKVAKAYDFNGDGYPDLALGNPYGTVSGHGSAGFVTIVYGSSSGLNLTKKQVFSQNTTGVPGTAESGDHFGYSLTSFDYDRDGYSDLLIGAPDEDTGAGVDAGSETILWGSSSGLTAYGSGAIVEPSPDAGAHHRFGYSLVSGDLDGDGYTDWVDSSPGDGYFWPFSSNPGTQAQVQASTRGFSPTAKPRPIRGSKGTVSPATTGTITALFPAVGDVNGDGKVDLVMAWHSTVSPTSGFDVWNFTTTDATVMGEALTRVDSAAVGDFDGDGFGDIAVGGADESAGVGGHVTVYKGDANVSLSTASTITEKGVFGTAVTGDQFGYSLSAGDVNKDGKYDLAVGDPNRTVSSQSRAGVAVMLYGSASGLGSAQGVSQSFPGVPGTAEPGDVFGWTVNVVDVNADGFADLIAGAPHENGNDGAVSLLKGTATVLTGSGSVTVGAGTLGVGSRSAQLGVRQGRTA